MNQRQLSFGAVTTKTVWGIIIFNTICFILQLSFKEITPLFALYTKDVFPFRIYTIFTYSFLHGSFSHLFFNMLSLYFFAGAVQLYLGTKRFFVIYIFSAIVGGLFSLLFTSGYWIVGASASIMGILTAYAIYFPHTKVLLFFVIPLPVRHLIYLFMALSIYFSIFGGGGNVAHLAHLGGILFPIFYCNKLWRVRYWIDEIKYKIKRRKFKVMK